MLLAVQQRDRTLPTLDLKRCILDEGENSLCAVNKAVSICDNGELKSSKRVLMKKKQQEDLLDTTPSPLFIQQLLLSSFFVNKES